LGFLFSKPPHFYRTPLFKVERNCTGFVGSALLLQGYLMSEYCGVPVTQSLFAHKVPNQILGTLSMKTTLLFLSVAS